MKKNKILLPIISIFTFSMLLFVTAFAADNTSSINNEKANAIQNYQIIDTNKDNVKELKVQENNNSKTVKIKYLVSEEKVTDEEVKNAYYYADKAYQQEMKFDIKGKQVGTFDYTLATGEQTFFYEQTASTSNEAEMTIYTLSETEKQQLTEDIDTYESMLSSNNTTVNNLTSSASSILSTTSSSVNMTDGFGGRANIANTTAKYLSTVISLPTTTEVIVPTGGTAYIYGGFVGGTSTTMSNISGDIGLQYSPASNYQIWKPFMNVNNMTYVGKALSGYEQVSMVNGFLPSTSSTSRRTVTMVIHPNNNQTGLAGSIRLKVTGLAKYATNLGTGGNTTLTAIVEAATSDQSSGVVKAFNITSVSNHKLCCTIALTGNDNTTTVGKNWCKFSSININGTAITTSKMTLDQEHATFPTFSNGTVEMNVNKVAGIV